MRPLYRLQSRLGLTSTEGAAALVIAVAAALGVGALEVQEHTGAPSAALYAEADSAFAAVTREGVPAADALAADTSARPALALEPLAVASGAETADALPVAAVGDAMPEAGSEAGSEAAPRRAPVTAGPRSGRKEPGRANLNTGTLAELQRLPGVGPAIAQRIVDYRNQNGPFRRVEDVVGVKGIGEKTLEKMRPYAHL